MHQYKVCVYAICKNEEKFVDRWMDSMQEADLVVVLDTGSSDNTVSRLRSRGALVYIQEISPWRFDEARNRSLSYVPPEVDICVCTDLDETFEPGWREHLETHWTADTTMGHYLYNWSLKKDGTPDTQFVYFKIHTKNNYTWSYPIHECLTYTGSKAEKKTFLPDVVLNHYPDPEKSRGSYLPLLEMAVKEQPDSDRMVYYLGREYLYAGQWQNCIDMLKFHLTLPSATWPEERCASMRWIAKAYDSLGAAEQAYSWYYRAIAEVPRMRDAYVECAQMAYRFKDWTAVYFMTTKAFEIKERSSVYVNMGYSWDHTPYDLAAIACYWLELYDASLLYAQKAVDISPDDPRLSNNLNIIRKKNLQDSDPKP